jgi:DNA-binding transcriptional ArsR family regulator
MRRYNAHMAKRKMLETQYRASRLCRVLGNPTAYQIIAILVKSRKTPTDLAEDLELSLKTTSETLRHLREIDLVRYVTEHNRKIYYLKDETLPTILRALEKYVKKMRIIKW